MDYKASILQAALTLAEDVGYQRITRDAVASRACTAAGLVNKYFGTIDGLKSAVLYEAIRLERLRVIAQGLAVGAHETNGIHPTLKSRALAAV